MPEQNITTKFTVDVSQFKAGITEANKQIKLANATFNSATAGMDDWQKSVDGIKAKLTQLASVLDAQKSKLTSYKQQLDAQQNAYDENGKRADELKAKLQQLAENGVSKTSEEYRSYQKQLTDVEKEQAKNQKAIDSLNVTILNQEASVKKTEKEMNSFEAELKDVDKGQEQVEDSAKGVGEKIEDAGEKAKKSSGKFKGLASTLASGIAKGFVAIGTAAIASGKKMMDFATETATQGDEVDKMSQKLGLSAEAYQKWDYVLGQSGVEITSIGAGIKTLTNQLDDAKNGSDDASARFEKLGLSMSQLQGMSREEVFASAIKGFQGMADSTERAALANDLFGKSGQNLAPLFNETSASTEELMQKAEELGFVMSNDAVDASANFQDSLDTLKRTFTGAKNSIMGELLPSLTSITDGLALLIAGDEEATEKLKTGSTELISTLSSTFSKFGDILFILIESIGASAPDVINSLVTGITQNLPMILSVATTLITTLASSIIANLPIVTDALISAVGELVTALTQPDIITQLVTAVSTMIVSLVGALPTLLPQLINAVVMVVNSVVTILPTILPQIVTTIIDTLVSAIPQLIQGALTLLMAIVDAIPLLINALIPEIPHIVSVLISTLISQLPILIQGAFKLFIGLVTALIKIIPQLVKMLPQIVQKVKDGLKEPVQKIFSDLWAKIKEIFNFQKVGEFFGKVWTIIKDKFKNVVSYLKKKFADAWKAVKGVFSKVGEFFGGIWDTIKEKFTNLGTSIGDAISGAVKSGINGVLSLIEKTINSGISLINGAIGLINKIPGVNIGTISKLYLPRLAKGTVVDNPTLAMIGEAGAEAVVPLENNTKWIRNVASAMAENLKQVNTTYNYTQVINSPKALSRLEIYRQTRNLLSYKAVAK